MSSWFERVNSASLSVRVMPAYLTAVDYYNELNTKSTRLAMACGCGNPPGLVTKDALIKVVEDVRNELELSFGILQIFLNSWAACYCSFPSRREETIFSSLD